MAVPVSLALRPTRTIRSRKDEDDGDGLLKKLGRGTLSSLAAAGNTLDLITGASSARDLASSLATGKWVNPFDQFATPFSSENRTSGRSLLEQTGLVGPNKPGLDFGDVAGFGTEVILDPGGAGLKLLSAPLKIAGTAATKLAGATRAGKAVGKAASTVGREARALMDARVMGRHTPEAQQAASKLFSKRLSTRQGVLSETLPIGSGLRATGKATPEAARAQRAAMEGVEGVRTPEMSRVKSLYETARQRKADLGGAAEPLDDIIEFSARRMGKNVSEAFGRSRQAGINRPLGAVDPADFGRQQVWKGFRKGSNGVDDLLTDPEWGEIVSASAKPGDAAKAIAQRIAGKYGNDVEQFYQRTSTDGKLLFEDAVGKTVKLTKEQAQQGAAGLTPLMKDRYQELASKIVGNPELRENGLFTNHWLVDANESLIAQNNWSDTAETMYDLLANPSVQAGIRPAFRAAGEKATTIGELLKSLKIDTKVGARHVAERMGIDTGDKSLKQVLNTVVRSDVADDVKGLWPDWTPPSDVHGLVKFFDSYQSMFKAGVLTWPARYVRDLVSGAVRNFERKMFDVRSGLQGHQLLQGRAATGLTQIPEVQQWLARTGRELNDANASDAVREIYASMKGTTSRIETEGFVPGAGGLDDFLEGIPGQTPLSAGEIGRRAIGRAPGSSLNPLDLRGVTRGGQTATDTKFGPILAGELVGRYTDDMNRLVPLINQMKKGRTAADAMKEINFAQVNYDPSTFTRFESSVLKRLFPFYSFSSRQLPYFLKTLATDPSGRLGKMIRANRLTTSDDPVPEHIAGTTAISLGEGPSGDKRYITGLGLMHEDQAPLLGPNLRDAGVELLSRMTPVIKGPLEYATGESFFQKGPLGGRELSDMDPTIGRTLTNIGLRDELPGGRAAPFISGGFEQFMANTPASRLLTTARTITDPRKLEGGPFPGSALAGQLLTGIRQSDVSPAASDAVLRDAADAAMRELGAQSYNITRFTKAQIEAASPEERAVMEQYNAVKDELARRSKSRKQPSSGR